MKFPIYLLRDCLVVSFLLTAPMIIIGCNLTPHTLPSSVLIPKLAQLQVQIDDLRSRLDKQEKHSHPTVLHEHIHPVVTEQGERLDKVEKKHKDLSYLYVRQDKLFDNIYDRINDVEIDVSKLKLPHSHSVAADHEKQIKVLEDKFEALEFGINITNGRIDDLKAHRKESPRIRPYKKYDKKPTLSKRTEGQCPPGYPLTRKPSYFPINPRKPIAQNHKHPWEFLIPTLEKRIAELESWRKNLMSKHTHPKPKPKPQPKPPIKK